MAVTVISATAWTTGDITVPADCTAVYMFYAGYRGTTGNILSSVTLETISPDQEYQLPVSTGTGTGVAVWYNPGTGSGRTPEITWSGSPTEGPVVFFVFVKGGNLTAWRDADAAHAEATGAVTVTVDSNTTDLVIKFDQHYGGSSDYPGLSDGWTSQGTQWNNSEAGRASTADSPGASSTVCDSENDYYSTIVAVSIPVASAAVSIDQEGFRFRNDDNNEASATWKADQDTNITLAAGTAFRIREILNATGDPASIGAQLEYSHKPSGGSFGSYVKVT